MAIIIFFLALLLIGLDLAGKFQITNGKMTNYRPEASDTKNSVQIFQISSIMLSNSIDDALLDKKLGSTDGAGYIAEQFLSTVHTALILFQNSFSWY